MKREQMVRVFFLTALVFLLIQVLNILSPFFTGILGAIVVVLMVFPIHRAILNLVGKNRSNLAATISTLLIFVVLVVPFLSLTWLLFKELGTLSPFIREFSHSLGHLQEENLLHSEWFNRAQYYASEIFGADKINLQTLFVELSTRAMQFLLGIGKQLPRHAFNMVINVLVMHFTLFFLFKDGQTIFQKIKALIPLSSEHKEQVIDKIYITLTAIVRGVFLVALVQGILCCIAFFIVGLKSALLLGFITVLAALIPFVGAAVIWLPIALYYLHLGILWKGIFLIVWGALVVSLIDNFLRVILIGGGAKLPILVIFFGLLGGLKVYGPKGIFLGPLAVALLLAFMRIYKEIYITPDSQNN